MTYRFKHKYNAAKTEVDGIKFDSKKEAERYRQLQLLVKSGEITGLVLQPSFILQEKFKKDGKTIRAITYKADFMYFQGGDTVVEDVKGFKTKEYLLKKKLFLKKYPNIKFKEV